MHRFVLTLLFLAPLHYSLSFPVHILSPSFFISSVRKKVTLRGHHADTRTRLESRNTFYRLTRWHKMEFLRDDDDDNEHRHHLSWQQQTSTAGVQSMRSRPGLLQNQICILLSYFSEFSANTRSKFHTMHLWNT